MLALFEQAALNDYPNPDRIDCPGSPFLRQLAFNRRSVPVSHPDLTHVARCSPCFREFLEYRKQVSQRAKQIRWVLIAAAVFIVMLVGGYFSGLRQNSIFEQIGLHTSDGDFTANLDMKDRSNVRGFDPSPSYFNSLHLPRKRVNLNITLPFASQAGRYEVQVGRDDGKPIVSGAGEARIENGVTILIVKKLALGTLSPGNYHIGIRRVPLDWSYNPIIID